ncbi:MAG: hypothetical protein ACTSYV_01480 [Candidatus Heimdallarchaeaceae archaeon]
MKIVNGKNVIDWELISFNAGEGQLFLTLRGDVNVEINGVHSNIITLVRKLGIERIKNSIIDLRTGTISVVDIRKGN